MRPTLDLKPRREVGDALQAGVPLAQAQPTPAGVVCLVLHALLPQACPAGCGLYKGYRQPGAHNFRLLATDFGLLATRSEDP
jgi:hypothetical protein